MNQFDVLSDRHVGKQPGLLYHISDTAPHLDFIHIFNVFSVDENLAFRRPDHHLQRRGLSAAAGTDDRYQFPIFNRQRDIRQDFIIFKTLSYMLKLYHSIHSFCINSQKDLYLSRSFYSVFYKTNFICLI